MNYDTGDHRLIDYLEKERRRKRGMWALIHGIIGFSFGWIPFLGLFFLPLWILAMVMGGFTLKNPKISVTGFIGFLLGAMAMLYKFGFWIIFFNIW